MRVTTFAKRGRMTTFATGRGHLASREWADEAVRRIDADANRSTDTHLHVFPLRAEWGIDLYLKDESVHPTGSLKHRLARSLFLYGLCSGSISEQTTIVEDSSGSTAISEADFAWLLGLPFVAMMPARGVADCALRAGSVCRRAARFAWLGAPRELRAPRE